MAAKEVICILCIGVGADAAPLSDKCDFVAGIMEGENRQQFLLKRSDSDGAIRTRDAIKSAHNECKRDRGDQK